LAEFTNEGIQEFVDLCIFTDRQLLRVIGRSIYPGGKLMSDGVKKAMLGIPTNDHLFSFATQHKRSRTGITTRQKAALIESFGIAEMRSNIHGWNVKLGFDGYNDIVSERWPKGQPNAMIARSLNSGTSFLNAYPFMDTAVANYANVTVKAIEEQFDKEIAKIWERYK